MIELDSAEFFSMVTPVRQLHVRPEMGYDLAWDESIHCVRISGKDLKQPVLVHGSNIKHMIIRVKDEPVKETKTSKPQKARAPKRTQKAKVPDKGLVQK